eukprot:gene21397-25725_t
MGNLAAGPNIGHPRPGVVDANAYNCSVDDINHVVNADSSVILFGSLRMGFYNGTFYKPQAAWCYYNETDQENGIWDGEKGTQLVGVRYAKLVADFIEYFEALGIIYDYLGLENESGYFEPQTFV